MEQPNGTLFRVYQVGRGKNKKYNSTLEKEGKQIPHFIIIGNDEHVEANYKNSFLSKDKSLISVANFDKSVSQRSILKKKKITLLFNREKIKDKVMTALQQLKVDITDKNSLFVFVTSLFALLEIYQIYLFLEEKGDLSIEEARIKEAFEYSFPDKFKNREQFLSFQRLKDFVYPLQIDFEKPELTRLYLRDLLGKEGGRNIFFQTMLDKDFLRSIKNLKSLLLK